jgi:putative ABC transport system permease protein
VTAEALPARRSPRLKSPLALRIALRELRAGAGGLAIFVLSIALGVAAVAAIGSLAASFDKALARQGRLLVGGDLSFERVHRAASAEERAAMAAEGVVSESASLRAMARLPGGKSALVELKAVDDAYPHYGEVVVAEVGNAAAPTPWRKAGTILVERPLLDRLGLKIGSQLSIGDTMVEVGGVLGQQPDRLADRIGYGPKVLLSLETLRRTGLVQPGSLVRFIYRLKLSDGRGESKPALKEARRAFQAKFPEGGFNIKDWTDPAPSLRREVDRFAQFVSLVGLAALLLGGIGVGNAIGSYMAKKRMVIATFKSLGASTPLVLRAYLLQSLLLASIGIGAGLLLGALAPAMIAAVYGAELPVVLATEPHPGSLLAAAAAGLLTTLLFVLLPLGRASAVPPAVLMRAPLSDEEKPVSFRYVAAAALCALALVALGLAASEERVLTSAIIGGIAAAFLLLWGFGLAIQKLAFRFRRARIPEWRLALASMGGPGSIAKQVSVSLGLGLGFLVAIALVQRSLLSELDGGLKADAPAYYFLDIDTKDLDAFQEVVLTAEPKAKLADAPMLRGRIVALNGVPVEKVKAAPEHRWVLSSDRGLTYTDTVPADSVIVAGSWWEKGYSGPPLVSFDAEAAEGLGLKVGDKVTVNVLGRNIEASIASLRKIDWESLAINFIMVFTPNTLAGAPHRALTTLELPKGFAHAGEAKLVQAIADRFPLVTAIKISDVVDAAKELLGKVMSAIRVTAGAILAIGALVLTGAILTSQDRRKYEAVLFKTLGATRRRILLAQLLEFGLLGVSTAVFATAAGALAAWALSKWAFDVDFVWSGLAAGATILLALVLMLAIGSAVSWRVLSAKAAPYLRGE